MNYSVMPFNFKKGLYKFSTAVRFLVRCLLTINFVQSIYSHNQHENKLRSAISCLVLFLL